MRRRKIFIGIPLEEGTGKRLDQTLAPHRGLPLRWTKPHNYHVTLLFIGYAEDDAVADICLAVQSVANTSAPFDLSFDRIVLTPEDLAEGGIPEMLWLTGEPSEPLRTLRERLEERLGIFVTGKKAFRPHVMLGRVRAERWSMLEETPLLATPFRAVLPVDSLTVFESLTAPGEGLRYEPLGVYPLSGDET